MQTVKGVKVRCIKLLKNKVYKFARYNMKNKLFVTLGILGMSLLSYAGTKHSLETSYPSYKGLIMEGIKVGFVDRKMEPAKDMVITELENNLMKTIVPLMCGLM